MRRAQIDAVAGQRDDLASQLAEYDALASGQRPTLQIPFEEFPHCLIAARIASGMTQGELAELMGIKEQQIQRYESTDYRPENLELWIRPQPNGIRVEDAVAWAREVLSRYDDDWRTSNNAHDLS